MIRQALHTPIPFWRVLLGGALFLGLAVFGYALFARSAASEAFFLGALRSSDSALLAYGSVPELGSPDFFAATKRELIRTKETFIEADLSSMRLRVYLEGEVAKDVAILAKGREGSWWETPAGYYRVEGKSPLLYSSFGDVFMPWSMPFQGNFIIHGWPQYADGRPVASSYSGGCIRLSNEDAEAVYRLVSISTPVLVFESDFALDTLSYERRAPAVTAESYLAADLGSGFVFTSRDSSTPHSIGTFARTLVALVATEYLNLERSVTIPASATTSDRPPRLATGESYTAFHLLYPLILEDSDEAGIALEATIGASRLRGITERTARAIGMASTTIGDPVGRSGENTASAEDFFNLARYLRNNRAFLLRISAGSLTRSEYGAPPFDGLAPLAVCTETPGCVGALRGAYTDGTETTETLLLIFDLPVRNASRPLAIVLIGSRDLSSDVRTILSWITETYLH